MRMYGIKFSLGGDFAHFRKPETQQVLETYAGPPRSAVIGMLGAALGKSRGETKELSEKVEIGVRVDRVEGWRKETLNIHNLKSDRLNPDPSTNLSFEYLNKNVVTPTLRNSLVRPKYSIAVISKESSFLKDLREKIRKPEYPIYLGVSEFLAWVFYVSEVEELESPETDDIFECFVPDPSDFTPCLETGLTIEPSVEKAPRITFSEDGERKSEFMEVLMQYNSKVGLEQEKEYYEIEGDRFVTF